MKQEADEWRDLCRVTMGYLVTHRECEWKLIL